MAHSSDPKVLHISNRVFRVAGWTIIVLGLLPVIPTLFGFLLQHLFGANPISYYLLITGALSAGFGWPLALIAANVALIAKIAEFVTKRSQ